MKPWLEDLSEEWIPQPTPTQEIGNSEEPSAPCVSQSVPSKPRSRLPRLRHSSRSLSEIQVRHIVKNGHLYYKPKSALSERSASDNNITSSPATGALNTMHSRSNSQSFSAESLDSVVHNCTIEQKPLISGQGDGKSMHNTPEWRRRLLKGDMGYGDQKDLFSPMGLENVFQKPSSDGDIDTRKHKSKLGLFKGLGAMPSSPPPWPSTDRAEFGAVGASPGVKSESNVQNLYESPKGNTSVRGSSSVVRHENGWVPRTVSGQIEFENENFSPVYLTTNLEIGGLPQPSPTLRGSDLAQRLRHLGSSPLSTHSTNANLGDHATSQMHGNSSFAKLQDDTLPEDLPTGTPDLGEVGRFVELKRGGYSRDGSFRRRPLSPSPLPKATQRVSDDLTTFGSGAHTDSEKMNVTMPEEMPFDIHSLSQSLATPHRPKAPKHLSPDRAQGSGSPLKLFEAHDTFTSNRLQRRLSQLENKTEKTTINPERINKAEPLNSAETNVRLTSVEEASVQKTTGANSTILVGRSHAQKSRVETFGRGQLDQYQFPEGFTSFPSEDSHLGDSDPEDSPCSDIAPPGTRQPLKFHFSDSPRARESSKSKRQGLTRVSNPFRSSSQLKRQSVRSSSCPAPQQESITEPEYAEGKRGPTSPFKNPTPKRRRTLYSGDDDQDDIFGDNRLTSIKDSHVTMQSVIGRKRKDARHEHSINIADPEVLARRHILRPRNPTPSQRRRDDGLSAEIMEATDAFILSSPKLTTIREHLNSPGGSNTLSDESRAAVVASEVAAFSMKRVQVMKDDSRKKSVTTQDFLDEAVKIMEYIRAKGRPASGLGSLEETESEALIDECNNELPSTSLSFSRPPSREGHLSEWREPNKYELDPNVMSHLRKFQEKESDDFMGFSIRSLRFSRMRGPGSPGANSVVVEQNNIRITDNQERYENTQSHDDNKFNSQPRTNSTHPSTASSMGQTIATASSRRSEHVATLAPEAVVHLIPEQIAGMSFDREKNIWVRQKNPSKELRTNDDNSATLESEDDPFGHIPDLTVDETAELLLQNASSRRRPTAETFLEESEECHALAKGRPVTRESKAIPAVDSSSVPSKASRFAWSFPKTETRATSWSDQETRNGGTREMPQIPTAYSTPKPDENDVEHEIKYFEGRGTAQPAVRNTHVRDITISISSPRPLPKHASEMQYLQGGQQNAASDPQRHDQLWKYADSASTRKKKTNRYHLTGAKTRPTSRNRAFQGDGNISILDDTAPQNYRMQLSMSVSASAFGSRAQDDALVPTVSSPTKGDITFMLSDLPEFTLNQVDECELPHRVIAKRDGNRFSNVLEDRYALGTAGLVKALQDVEPDEPYWEDLRELSLKAKSLTNLHRLDEFCYRLEELDISNNAINQVEGIPFTVRRLQAQKNSLTGLTSWALLMNLQHLDISQNDIDSLDGLSQLVHLRSLKVDNNKVTSLASILQLDGLIELNARGNKIETVDFDGANLSSASILGQCKMLRSLRLCGNKTTKLRVDGYFPNLESLYVDDNSLDKVVGLEDLTCLRTFSAREQTPKADSDAENRVGNLIRNPDVRSLYISVNPARFLDVSQHLLNLQRLELASMGLKALPDNFGQLTPNLRSINLNFNSIKDLRPLLNIKRLNELLIAGNKLARLRTNLAVIGRLTTLAKLDLRGNPLTLRFYAPTIEDRVMSLRYRPFKDDSPDKFILPPRNQDADYQYLSRLDEETRLRRRVHEMMLATSCRSLQELDGLTLDKAKILVKDDIWQRLLCLGIIRRSENTDRNTLE
ncbi:hypothetical protein CC78DRAFT_566508 [Lojkania enalia]|uniref:Septation initiation network scaffold protein cdc11 n=1 Tax=Lojkania enalia TaxID=147567 RepID=A0A9P4N8X8_9PLEO|nr:hypothetical protein CC78DRAFT_566508 [Didymosphaeria enalia]